MIRLHGTVVALDLDDRRVALRLGSGYPEPQIAKPVAAAMLSRRVVWLSSVDPDDVERETCARIVAWLRGRDESLGTAYVHAVRGLADAIERGDWRVVEYVPKEGT